MKKIFILFTVVALTIWACTDTQVDTAIELTPKLPDAPYDYDNLRLPLGSNISNNMFFDDFSQISSPNQIVTNQGATLGRVLFYDKKLSLNNTVSCGPCHHQDKAFADGKQFSTGFQGRVTTRNSMAIVNPILQNNLFWDSRSKTIHDLSLQPVQNHIEMGMEDIDKLVSKLEYTEYYKPLFQNTYGSSEITPEKISMAIAQFVASITTSDSKFDTGLRQNFSNFSDLEIMGMNIFNSERGKCSSCHGGNAMVAQDGPDGPYGGGGSISGQDLRGATNIGLDLVYKDNGLGNGNFKISSLRNIELTAPYMHDGRFKTLEEVVNHYSEGIKPHKNLDVKFTDGKGNIVPLHFTSIEKKALVAFLKTLTDMEMTKNVKWSDPFKS